MPAQTDFLILFQDTHVIDFPLGARPTGKICWKYIGVFPDIVLSSKERVGEVKSFKIKDNNHRYVTDSSFSPSHNSLSPNSVQDQSSYNYPYNVNDHPRENTLIFEQILSTNSSQK